MKHIQSKIRFAAASIMLGILVIATWGCNKAQTDVHEAENPSLMSFEMQFPSGSATRATATDFEEGDAIGVYVTEYSDGNALPVQISGNRANNVSLTFDGSTWTPSKKLYWPASEGEKVDIVAYYPYMTPTTVDEQPFSVALDQTTAGEDGKLGGYEASDFLWAKVSGAVQNGSKPVTMKFAHRCSKLTIKLIKGTDYEGDLPDNAQMYIHNTVTQGTIDFNSGFITKYLFGEPETIHARKVDDATYEAVIIPQQVTTRRPFVEMIVGKVSYLVEDTFNFKPGLHYTYSLTLNSSTTQIGVSIGAGTGTWD